MPLLIRLSYRFVTTYAFLDISFLEYRETRKRNDGVVLQCKITPD
nr:hypothetical protein [Candidatus Enterovibrio escacola]